jgi:hypothetical protein
MKCAECNHEEGVHFSFSLGSFCTDCPMENFVWEHAFVNKPHVFPPSWDPVLKCYINKPPHGKPGQGEKYHG